MSQISCSNLPAKAIHVKHLATFCEKLKCGKTFAWKSYKPVIISVQADQVAFEVYVRSCFAKSPPGSKHRNVVPTSQLKRFVAPGYIVALPTVCSSLFLGILSTHNSFLPSFSPWCPASFILGPHPSNSSAKHRSLKKVCFFQFRTVCWFDFRIFQKIFQPWTSDC